MRSAWYVGQGKSCKMQCVLIWVSYKMQCVDQGKSCKVQCVFFRVSKSCKMNCVDQGKSCKVKCVLIWVSCKLQGMLVRISLAKCSAH